MFTSRRRTRETDPILDTRAADYYGGEPPVTSPLMHHQMMRRHGADTDPGVAVFWCPTCRAELEPSQQQIIVACQACTARLRIPIDRRARPVKVTTPVYAAEWVTLRCPQCRTSDEWPAPGVTCRCGTRVRFPLDGRKNRRPSQPQFRPAASPSPSHSTAPSPPLASAADPTSSPHSHPASKAAPPPFRPEVRRQDVQQMTPKELESMVAALLRRDGCTYADRVGGRGDEGIDVIGRTAGGRSILVQCKHYRAQKVSPREVREFAGAAAAYPGALRLFVTTNEYTRDATRWAAEKGGVIAIDLVYLLRWANRIWSPLNT